MSPSCILVVDDDPDVRFVFADWLEELGYETLMAENGRVGLELVRDRRPDLVLCDLRMPEIDGLSMLSTMAEEKLDIPVVVVSGADDLASAVEALKLGADDYIIKPILDFTVLEHAVGRALELAELTRQNQQYRENLETANQELRLSLARAREDEESGRRIQVQLLPPSRKSFGDIECAHALLPSTTLSGDFIDYFAISEDKVGLYLTDVSGHGVPSAMVTVLIKSFFAQCREAYRLHADMTICHPARVLQRLNDFLLEQRLHQHLTIFYAVVNQAAGTLSYCNGGQFPYPVLHTGHHGEFLQEQGPAVGLFEFARYEERSIDLPSDFTLTVLSDGVLELIDEPSLAAKEARLFPLLDQDELTIDQLWTELDLTAKQRLPDDVALLVATRRHG